MINFIIIIIILLKKIEIIKMNKVEADYVPRRCEATNRVIAANDHASVLIPIAEVS